MNDGHHHEGGYPPGSRSWKHLPRVLPYLRRYWRLAGVSVVLLFFGVGVSLLSPWPMAFMVDTVLGSHHPAGIIARFFGHSKHALVVVAAVMGLFVALAGNMLNVVTEYVNTRLDNRLRLDFRRDLFEKAQQLPLSYHDTHRAGYFAQNINTHTTALGRIVVEVPPLIESVLTLIGMFVIAFALDPVVAVLSLTVVPFIYYSTIFYGKHIEPRLIKTRDQEGLSLSVVHEAMQMLRVILAFRREDHELKRFSNQAEHAIGLRVNVTVKQTLFSLAVNVITAVGTALVLGFGAAHVLAHKLTVGELLVLMGYIASVYNPLQTISYTIGAWQEQLVDFWLALELLDQEIEIVEKPDAVHLEAVRGHVTFDNVEFAYPDRPQTLKGVSFDVPAGSVVALVGPTGAGKTTLINMIPRFYDTSSGRVLVDGHDVRDLTLDCLRKSTAIVLQDPLLFKATIAENIRYGRLEASMDEVMEAARLANAHDFIMALPMQYETVLGERGAMLSGGERQRICIARAFLKDAPILILDEPTSSIDSRTEGAILEALDRLMIGRTTFIVAHRLSTIGAAHKILVLEAGRLVDEGTHDELLSRPDGLYRQLWEAQTGHRKTTTAAATVKAPPNGKTPAATVSSGAAAPAGPTAAAAGAVREDPHPVAPTEQAPEQTPEPAPAPSPSPPPAVTTAGRTATSTPSSIPTPTTSAPATPTAPTPAPSTATFAPVMPGVATRPKAVVLGMMTKMPVAGVVWQTIHYLLGLERLGFDAYYVEAHARTPSMLMEWEDDDGTALAARFIGNVMSRFGLGDRWAFHALHDDGSCLGLSESELMRVYAEAAVIFNLHGGTEPRPEHYATGRLVYIESDPCQLQVELKEGRRHTTDFLDPHVAFFTFGENLGNPDCGLPVPDRYTFLPTRQPVLVDLWDSHGIPASDTFTTIGNWRQVWRDITLNGEIYHWSKHHEFLKLIDLPRMSGVPLELALSSYDQVDRELLEAHGWLVRPGLGVSSDPERYRSYIAGSRGELTVAKDQNVRLRSGWFSDRSATYLAAGRPVVTQDTGFGNILPTGNGLFSFATQEEAAASLVQIQSAYVHHSRHARAIAREYFDARVVLGDLLDRLGIRPSPRRRAPNVTATDDLVLTPESRRPLVLPAETTTAVLDRPVPFPEQPATASPMPAVTLVVVTHDNLACTRLCLESVLEGWRGEPIEVVAVDNASTDGTVAYFGRLAANGFPVRIICNASNRGFSTAVNQGCGEARGDAIVILNNDTIVPPGWLGRLLPHLLDGSVGAVGPVTGRIGNEAEIDARYRTYGEFLQFAAARAKEHEGQSFDIPMLAMFCFAIRRDVLQQIGPLDEQFGLGLFEDDDYAERLHAAGYRLVCAEDVFVHHFGEATFGDLVAAGEYAGLFQENRARFEKKWGVTWSGHGRRPDPNYDQLVAHLQTTVKDATGADAVVLVATRGDANLLELGRTAGHFPMTEDGRYAGAYPADSGDAINHLRWLQQGGATHLLLPEPSRWWLDHYEGFGDYLARAADVVLDDETGILFALRGPVPPPEDGAPPKKKPARAPRKSPTAKVAAAEPPATVAADKPEADKPASQPRRRAGQQVAGKGEPLDRSGDKRDPRDEQDDDAMAGRTQ